jgi:hypothetical protein
MNQCSHIVRRRGESHRCNLPDGHWQLHQATPIRQVSDRRRFESRRYKDLRAAFLAPDPTTGERPRCAFPEGCEAYAVVVHHRRGRFGKRLLDVDWWARSCAYHNDYAETHTGHSLAIGWLIPIEGAL